MHRKKHARALHLTFQHKCLVLFHHPEQYVATFRQPDRPTINSVKITRTLAVVAVVVVVCPSRPNDAANGRLSHIHHRMFCSHDSATDWSARTRNTTAPFHISITCRRRQPLFSAGGLSPRAPAAPPFAPPPHILQLINEQ